MIKNRKSLCSVKLGREIQWSNRFCQNFIIWPLLWRHFTKFGQIWAQNCFSNEIRDKIRKPVYSLYTWDEQFNGISGFAKKFDFFIWCHFTKCSKFGLSYNKKFSGSGWNLETVPKFPNWNLCRFSRISTALTHRWDGAL